MRYNKEPGIREIPIDSIASASGIQESPFCISYGYDLSPMISSMEGMGLINPVVVTPCQEKGKYWVVCGHKRVLAAHELGWKKIASWIYRFDHMLDGLWLSVHDNLATRELNPVEKACVLSKMAEHLNWEQIKEQLIPLLGLPAHKPAFELYRDIWTRFDDNLKQMTARGEIGIRNAKRILGLDDRDIKEISKLFSTIKFNLNQQAQLIDLLVDISHMKGLGFPEILKNGRLKEAIEGSRITSARRAEALIARLKRIRNPMAEAAWDKMKRKIRSLSLPEGVKLHAPPYFEGSSYRIDILFSEGQELLNKLNEILEIKSLMEIQQPIEEAAKR